MSQARSRRLLVVVTACAASVLGVWAPTAASAVTGPDTRLVSSALDGGPANGWADRPQLSGNGRFVTFDSRATDLVPNGMTTDRSVYERDLVSGATTLVTVAADGSPATGWSSYSWPSDDGRYVAFTSDSPDVVAAGNLRRSVFVRDMVAGATELVSITDAGRPANGASSRPMLSSDGRYVAYSSFATNLSPAGGNGSEQVYVRDRVVRTTTLISQGPGGVLGGATSFRGMVSDDGQTVTFASKAGNLGPVDTNGKEDVYQRNAATGVITRLSLRSDGSDARSGGSRPYMSPDARYVVFNTYDAIGPGDLNGKSDVYVLDRVAGTTTRASVSTTGGDGTGDSLRGFVSNDGRYVFFNSFSSNLVTPDRNGSGDAFVRDLATGVTSLVSVSPTGGPANGQTFRPVPSADGGVVTYLSLARNLVPGDTSVDNQVYVVSRASLPVGSDTGPPSVAVTSPATGSTTTSPFTVTGTASDDRGVDRVAISVRDNVSLLWLQADGTWATTQAKLPATVDQQYTPSTTWSKALSLPTGSYRLVPTAYDDVGTQATTRPYVTFAVSGGSVRPTVAVTASTPGAGVTLSSPARLGGTAADNIAGDRVTVSVKNTASGRVRQAGGTWAARNRFTATLDAPDPGSSGWSISFALSAGMYGLSRTAVDVSGNEIATRPFTSIRAA